MLKYTCMTYKRYQEIPRELKIRSILDSILKYETSWIEYIGRMQRNRFPKLLKLKIMRLTKVRKTLEGNEAGTGLQVA
jgi:hypothetical protein